MNIFKYVDIAFFERFLGPRQGNRFKIISGCAAVIFSIIIFKLVILFYLNYSTFHFLKSIFTIIDSKYESQKGYNCFINKLKNIDISKDYSYEFEEIKKNFYRPNKNYISKEFMTANNNLLNNVEKLYSKNKDTIEIFINTYSYSDKWQEMSLDGAKKMGVNINNARALMNCMINIAYYKYCKNDHESALNLMLAMYRFAAIIYSGDFNETDLQYNICAIALKKKLLSEFFWHLLLESGLDISYYKQFEAEFEKLISKKIDLLTLINQEKNYVINILNKEFKVAGYYKKTILKELAENYDRTCSIYSASSTPVEFSKTLDDYMFNVMNERLHDPVLDFKNPESYCASWLTMIAFPNLGRLNNMNYEMAIREKGVLLLLKFIIAREKNRKIPATAEEFEKMCGEKIPVDIYSPNGDKCIYKYEPKTNIITLYSIGPDQIDGKCTSTYDDYIYFKIRL
ncbi:MAG: hypothetical protein QMC67_17510 [Candidatus Wallbacteria bacterium]